jgi:hypothetical protein
MPSNKTTPETTTPTTPTTDQDILAAVAAFGGLAGLRKAQEDAAKLASLGNFETVKNTLADPTVAAKMRAQAAKTAPESLLSHVPSEAGAYTVEVKDGKIRTAYYTTRHDLANDVALGLIKSLAMVENRRLEFVVTLGTDNAPSLGPVTSTPMRIGAGRHAKTNEIVA